MTPSEHYNLLGWTPKRGGEGGGGPGTLPGGWPRHRGRRHHPRGVPAGGGAPLHPKPARLPGLPEVGGPGLTALQLLRVPTVQ